MRSDRWPSEAMEDPYDHPDGVDCIYIQSSVHHDDEIYDVQCACDGDLPCSDNFCQCLSICGKNYDNGKLINEKLSGIENSVFECSENCGCGDRCTNKISQKGPSHDLVIASTSHKGHGIFAKRPIPKGTFLCEYAGEILTEKEMNDRPNASWPYVITLNENTSAQMKRIKTFIDASKFGNVGRYLNHSCSPNCVLVPIRYENVAPKVGIFALKDITAGEECCYLYGNENSLRSQTPCLCRSESCKLFLPLGCKNTTN